MFLKEILYLFYFCTGEEQQGPGTLTIRSHPPQAQRIYTRTGVLTCIINFV